MEEFHAKTQNKIAKKVVIARSEAISLGQLYTLYEGLA
jgi:hypothetical protein